MTNNQIKLREIREKERSNKVSESIKSGELAETITNNLRNYHVNIQKNRIQALADERLDERERMKLAETIRSNLAQELETNRANLANEEIKRIQNAINSLKNKYEPGAILAAIFGLMPENEIRNLYGDSGIINYARDLVDYFSGNPKSRIRNVDTTKSKLPKAQTDPNVEAEIYDPRTNSWSVKKKNEDERNEIPTDLSQSVGPSTQIPSPRISIGQPPIAYNNGKANDYSTSNSSTHSPTTGHYIDTGSNGSAAVYVSPGANLSPVGPGNFI